MKKVYFAGKFDLSPDPSLSLAERLKEDYRTLLAGDISYAREPFMLYDSFLYLGPFYSEQASDGDFTSTDCNTVLGAEAASVDACDVLVVVFGEAFSVGSIVELGWAVEKKKEIIILYKEESGSPYDIRSEYWFAIADAKRRGAYVSVAAYQDSKAVPAMLLSLLNGNER